jgi:hypothetical protein
MSLTQTTDRLTTIASGLASLVWWEFNGTSITPADLRTRVAAAGLDPASVKDIDPTDAVRRAVREFRVHEGKRVTMEAAVAHEDDSFIVVNLLTLTQQARERVAKLPTDEMVWDKVAGTWHTTGLTQDAATLRANAAELATFLDGNAVRDLLVQPSLERASSFSLRRGMYVVPHATSQPVVDAQRALAGLDTFRVQVAQVQAGQGWEQPLAEASRAELRNDLDELRVQIDGWRDMAKRVRSDTQEHVLARFSSIAQRAALYREALAVAVEDIEDDVAEMQALAEDIIAGKAAEADSRTTTRKAEQAASAPAVTQQQARRAALRAMTSAQLGTLWDALGSGEQPTEREALVEALATAMEAQAA